MPLSLAELTEVLEAVEQTDTVVSARRLSPPIGIGSELEVRVTGSVARLKYYLLPQFPLELPVILLKPWDHFGMIPHVLSPEGVICYQDMEGILVDRLRPTDVARACLDRGLQVLEDGVSGRNRADFTNEWESYWNRRSDAVSVMSVVEPSDAPGWGWVVRKGDGTRVVAMELDAVASLINGHALSSQLTQQRAYYHVLEAGTLLVPPEPGGAMWNCEEARSALTEGLSEKRMKRLRRDLKGRTRHHEYVIVNLPRPSGGHNLFGIRFDQPGKIHPLLEGGTARRAVPIALTRYDKAFLLPRGGGNLALSTKRALLVGCGAIGGHLAFELARAGILDLTLVDSDDLKSENAFRHVLGRRYWGKNKAEALKEELEANLVHLRVNAIPERIENVISQGKVEFDEYDTIVFAAGNPTVELEMNERIQWLGNPPIAVYTWVEPFGIGGHALLTGNGGSAGCFECLYTSPSAQNEPLHSRISFAVPDPAHPFARAVSGCGSLHTPYGSLDAVRTANLAARLVVEALTGVEPGNPLRSWKGDPTAYLAEGYELAPRFNSSDESLHRFRYEYRAPTCRVCAAASSRSNASQDAN